MPWDVFARRKFGGGPKARGAFARLAAVGEGEGFRFDFDRVASAPNTVDAHRLILSAGEHDRGARWGVVDAPFEQYFSDGRNLNDHGALPTIAAGAGLDGDEVRRYLEDEDGRAEVRGSQEEAYGRGIRGVPFYVFDGGRTVSGPRPVEAFLRALDGSRAGQAGWETSPNWVTGHDA